MAWLGRSIEAVSEIEAPSTSKAMYFNPYWLMTCWQAAAKVLALLQSRASSVPLAPPNDTLTSPPAGRGAVMKARSQKAGSTADSAVRACRPLW